MDLFSITLVIKSLLLKTESRSLASSMFNCPFVSSPTLFNLYMCKMPTHPDIIIITYADDTSACKSGTNIGEICADLTTYLDGLNNWFKARNLIISPSKSSATLFTTSSNECKYSLDITIDNQAVPTVQQPKILGVVLDNLVTFKHHAQAVKTKLQSRNNVLKALAGSTWGKDKEVITTTYKAIGRSVLNYAAPIWTPNLSETNWNHLQTAQNNALRIATGCTRMTQVEHLHDETNILPVKEHCQLLSKQFLLRTQLENHPNKRNLINNPPRLMKNTLASEFGREIEQLIPEGGLTSELYKQINKKIHTDSVARSLSNRRPNKVLLRHPPKICKTEETLPRKTRVRLAQLRSGYSPMLNSYMNKIDPTTPNSCPDCNNSPHDTVHLFTCPVKNQQPVDTLWTDPVSAARHLGLDTGVPEDQIPGD